MLAAISSMTTCSSTPRPSAVVRTYSSTLGPHIQPGTTVFTRIPYPPSSTASARAAVLRQPFDTAYPACRGSGRRVTMELTNTMEPPPCRFIGTNAALASCSAPNRLTSSSLRHLSRSTSSNVWKTSGRYAQSTSASTRPNSWSAAATSRSHCAGSTTLVGTTRAVPPSAVISPETSSRKDAVRAPITTVAPWPASARATSRPRPGPTPATTQTRSDSSMMPPQSCRAGQGAGRSPLVSEANGIVLRARQPRHAAHRIRMVGNGRRRHGHGVSADGQIRAEGQRALLRLMGDLRPPTCRQPSGGLPGRGLRGRGQFLRQRRGVLVGRVRADHGGGDRVVGLAPPQLRAVDQALLGDPSGCQHAQHPQSQVPAAGHRRVADALRPRLRRPRLLPPARPRDTHRGDGMGDVGDHLLRQGPLLGHLRVVGRGTAGGLGHRRSPPPAQAGGGAAPVQPVVA